jgi:hypothetical protein
MGTTLGGESPKTHPHCRAISGKSHNGASGALAQHIIPEWGLPERSVGDSLIAPAFSGSAACPDEFTRASLAEMHRFFI